MVFAALAEVAAGVGTPTVADPEEREVVEVLGAAPCRTLLHRRSSAA